MCSEYRGCDELGIPALRDVTTFVPFDDTMTTAQVDEQLRTLESVSGANVRFYAALDLRASASGADDPPRGLELMAFLRPGIGPVRPPSANDQLERYLTTSVVVNDTSVRFPGILPLLAEANLFLRHSRHVSDSRHDSDDHDVSPEVACNAVHTMLQMSQLAWTDLASRQAPSTLPLGRSERECEAAVRTDGLSTPLRHYLSRIVRLQHANDTLRRLRVAPLPKRPQTTVAGPLEGTIVIYMTYLFLWPYVRLVRDIVLEKEKQLKEYLLIMGLQSMALLLSWFVLYLGASVAVAAVAVSLLAGVMFVATPASAAFFVLLFVTFASSILCFGVSITPLFHQAKTAAACASLLYFVLSAGPFVRALAGDDAIDSSVPLSAVVLGLETVSAPVVFMAALRAILGLDAVTGAVRPIVWATVRGPCERMAVQSAAYLLLGWYLEHVFPRTYGVQQPWYFLLQPSYWFPSLAVSTPMDDSEDAELLGLDELPTGGLDPARDTTLREMPLAAYVQQFKPVLFVHALSKRYPNGKDALANVSFGVQKGEIFGLLGPNGAGKSTTLSILCGMLSPTTGDAIVGGAVSVARSPELVRKSLSVCFQQNILFDDLSVDEHLALVCALKHAIGVPTVAPETWDAKLQQFGLLEKRSALAKTLSGGQKRKLSLVLALLDNARVVLLDEPTAGMDLKARLDTWDALKRAVSHRAVILTTHSMQEAEALCENIGIVADGRLKCCGSSLFLRERFGVGYKLTLVHLDDASGRETTDDSSRRVSTEELTQLVRTYVPNATVASDNKWETRFQLTDGRESSFVPLFEQLEAMCARHELKRYAIAATDLEDVFVRVTEGEAVYNHAKDDAMTPDAASASSYGSTDGSDAAHDTVTGLWLAAAQVHTLCAKRAKMALRDKKMLFAQYVWPLAVFAILLAAVQHLAPDTRAVESVTTLPLSAASSSFFYLSSPPELADRVRQVLAHVHHAVYEDAASEQIMVDAIAGQENTSFFAAAYISRLHWPDTDTDAANATVAGGSLEFSLLYNQSIARSLPVGIEMLSEAYCRAGRPHASPSSEQRDTRSCRLAVKAGVLQTRTFIATALVVGTDDSVSDSDGNDVADAMLDLVNRLILAYYLLLTISSIVSYYVTPVVKERESGLKRQQYLHMASRATSGVYWTANVAFDFAVYFVAVALVALVIRAFSTSVTADVLLVWWLALVVFGAAMLPFTYLVSLAFASHSSAQSFMSYASLFQILATMAVATMASMPSLCVKVQTVASLLQVLPFYSLGMLVTNVATVEYAPAREQCVQLSAQLEAGGQDDMVSLMASVLGSLTSTPSVWAWTVSGSHFVALLASAVLYWLLLLVCDQWQMYPTVVSHKLTVAYERVKRTLGLRSTAASDSRGYDGVPASEEDDVERAKRCLVDVVGVTKVFNPKKKTTRLDVPADTTTGDENEAVVRNEDGQVVALNDVSFSVERNDCVALLGVNGSGKSTLFEILTAGTAPTRGSVWIDGFDATLEPTDASMRFGYCPQTNLLFSELTVREHLELFYQLRSRQRRDATRERAVVDALMARLDLFPVETTAAENLSGGNKRRLMLALSLLSEHVSLLLLDEPSAGVDVVARRLMWRVLHVKRQQSRRRTSCLFTTHSMEEAEAVCANAVVLFKGDVVWSGSIPDLKQHASRGVSISLRLDSAVVLSPERVAEFAHLVHDDLTRTGVSGTQALAESGQIRLEDLERAYVLCRQWYRPVAASGAPEASVVLNRLRREDWFAGIVSRIRHQDAGDGSGDGDVVAIDGFVREWLIQEDLATLEQALFAEQITSVSGEPVTPMDSQSASGSSTTAVYETACTDAFGLAALFDTLERNKRRFGVAQYSVSELSLERVFEQFT